MSSQVVLTIPSQDWAKLSAIVGKDPAGSAILAQIKDITSTTTIQFHVRK